MAKEAAKEVRGKREGLMRMNSPRRESAPESTQRQRFLLLFLHCFRFLPLVLGEFFLAPLIVSLDGKHARITSAVAARIAPGPTRPSAGLESFLPHLANRRADRLGFHQQIAHAFEQIVNGK